MFNIVYIPRAVARRFVLVPRSGPLGAHVAGQEEFSATMDNERSAIERAIQSYVAAFNAQNAKAMAKYWSAEGVYISKLSGERVVGRKAIAAAIAEMFAAEGKRQLVVSTESIEFISPNVALDIVRNSVDQDQHSPVCCECPDSD